MIEVIRGSDRYHIENEWLSSYWHFSFDHYYDAANMSFGPLRVFNDDVVAPANGFPLHPHREMEIVTYMIDGQLEHKDTAGNRGVISPGEVQRMSAGTGIRHSEFNPSDKTPAHLLQLWIEPAVARLAPSWEQKSYPLAARSGKLLPIAVPAGKNGQQPAHAVEIHQDATIYTSLLGPGETAVHTAAPTRRGYVFVIRGELEVNGETLHSGDQARISGEKSIHFAGPAVGANAAKSAQSGAEKADFLFLDLP
jgi:redox-sensitive bicupin YhaK (pirin superfamily)